MLDLLIAIRNITLLVLIFILPSQGNSQYILDACLGSVGVGPDFVNSTNLANSASNGADIIAFQNGTWNGLNGNISNGVNIQPPVECTNSRAAFLRVISTDTIGQGVGLKLSSSLVPGSSVTFQFTYVSHGIGSAESFQPVLYTHFNSQFLDDEGNIAATWATNCPTVGTSWETVNVTWTVNSNISQHNWLWFYAPESSGLLFNFCQIESGPLEFDQNASINICEGESVIIGQDLGDGVSYSWSNGVTEATQQVSQTNNYIVEASNFCNTVLGQYTVVVNGPPELVPSIDEILLCEGETLELTTDGLNPVNEWPDGTDGESWEITEEGVFEISITDDCFTSTYEITADYDTIPFIDLGPDISLCEGQSTVIDGTVEGWEDVIYSWSTGNTEPEQVIVYQDTYTLTVENDCGSYSDDIFVEYSLVPDSILPPEIFLCKGHDYLFDLSHIDAISYTWSDGSDGPTLLTEYTGPYWVEILDDDFCFIVRDTVWVHDGDCECPLYLPNAFTPDYDGLNDSFSPVWECLPYDFTMEIYDRWGVVVFRTYDAFLGWNGRINGTQAPQGTYHWRLWYRESYDGIPIEKFGSVSVIGHRFGQ